MPDTKTSFPPYLAFYQSARIIDKNPKLDKHHYGKILPVMKVTVQKQPKSALKLTITVPNTKVRETYEALITDLVKTTEISGFRKGSAPRKMVEEKTDTSKLYGDIINKLLKTYYPQALKENHISPISNPKVEIKEFDLEKDFEFSAVIATKPEVKVKDFRKKLKALLATKNKAADKKSDNEHASLTATEVVDILLETADVEVPNLLVDEETNRMMARLINQAQTIGMSLEQYLKAQNKTSEELRTEYNKISEKNLKTEFVLEHLVKEEKIEIKDSEVEETAKATGDPKTLENLKDPIQKWYIKSILGKNKLINKLIEEVEQTIK
jgi:FKBP-type peptidyl-prolyl cis-trans isomerase (trigger factor)